MLASVYSVLPADYVGQGKGKPVSVSDVKVETRFDSEGVLPSPRRGSDPVSWSIRVVYAIAFVDPFVRMKALVKNFSMMSVPETFDRLFSANYIQRITICPRVTPYFAVPTCWNKGTFGQE